MVIYKYREEVCVPIETSCWLPIVTLHLTLWPVTPIWHGAKELSIKFRWWQCHPHTVTVVVILAFRPFKYYVSKEVYADLGGWVDSLWDSSEISL